jgi:hypothetical protein
VGDKGEIETIVPKGSHERNLGWNIRETGERGRRDTSHPNMSDAWTSKAELTDSSFAAAVPVHSIKSLCTIRGEGRTTQADNRRRVATFFNTLLSQSTCTARYRKPTVQDSHAVAP